MSFAHATVRDGIPFLLVGLSFCWIAFRPVPDAVANDPKRLARYRSWKEYLTFAGPGLTIASAIYMLVKASMY